MKNASLIDHSILSPSGRVSKKYRALALERTRQALFGDGLAYPQCPQESERDCDLRRASEFRELAQRGMHPKKYLKEAIKIESKWSDA